MTSPALYVLVGFAAAVLVGAAAAVIYLTHTQPETLIPTSGTPPTTSAPPAGC